MESRYTYELVGYDAFGQRHAFSRLNDTRWDNAQWQQVYGWCEEQFGREGCDDAHRWSGRPHCGTIWIRGADDAFAFRLRWC